MKPVREIISREIIDVLWGAGYTILPRARHPDPFNVPPGIVPQSRSYQWMHLIHDKVWIGQGWAAVPASRHDGYFMPAGFIGDIEVNGLGLFEKPKFEVERDKAERIASTKDFSNRYLERWGGIGQFAGEVTIGTQTKLGELDTVQTAKIGNAKSIENVTAIPRDMTPYIAQIFEEREYLRKLYADDCSEPAWSTVLISEIASKMEAAMKADPAASKWPTLNAIILPFAIANVRKRITEEAANASQAS